jgi:glycosyltransferase involved in cell wall biosynthesis
MPMKPIVSVVICTFNRAPILKNCLLSLACQDAPVGSFEVIVVDNNSRDNTKAIFDSFSHPAFHYLRETRQGTSAAKNYGSVNAKGSYLAFMDDDAMAAPDWITQILHVIERSPDISFFGGPYFSYALVNKPRWFPVEYGEYHLAGNVTQPRPINFPKEFLNGTNMIISKNLFFSIQMFSTTIGPAGEKMAYGEDTHLQTKAVRSGISIYYSLKIIVRHLIAGYKMHLRWLLWSSYANGKDYDTVLGRKIHPLLRLVRLAGSSLLIISKLLTLPPMPLKRRIYYSFSRFFFEYGATLTLLKRCTKSFISVFCLRNFISL